MDNKYRHNIRSLAESIYYWLCYINSITSSNILAESSIRYPLVEYLERREQMGGAVELEMQLEEYHKRHMDFHFKHNDNADEFYMELKYASYYTSTNKEKQRIFNDLMRLAFYSGEEDKFCYFIMCGSYDDFMHKFVFEPDDENKVSARKKSKKGINNKCTKQYNRIYSKWFSFDLESPGKDISRKSNISKDYIDCYNSNYDKMRVTHIATELISIIPNITKKCDEVMNPSAVAIWRVTKI